MNNALLINATSNNVEWYTPSYIVEPARQCMGSIDLDPASCWQANRVVKAAGYFELANNGLELPWNAPNVWLNHPFGKAVNKLWINKLISEYEIGNFEQACGICFASTSEAWFQPLYDYPLCFISPRVNYVGQDGKPVAGVTKGSVVYYLGPNRDRFTAAYRHLCRRVMVPACLDAPVEEVESLQMALI